MNGHNVIRVLTVAASLLLFSTAAYAWSKQWETLDFEKDWDYEGGYAHSEYDPYSWAYANAEIDYPEELYWGGAYAYLDGRWYIEDYDGENLTAYVSCESLAYVCAYDALQESDYFIKAATYGYAGPYTTYAYVEVSEPSPGDIDPDSFYREEIDMSYPGATIYAGDIAFAQAEAYYTDSHVKVEAYARSHVTCDVEEDP